MLNSSAKDRYAWFKVAAAAVDRIRNYATIRLTSHRALCLGVASRELTRNWRGLFLNTYSSQFLECQVMFSTMLLVPTSTLDIVLKWSCHT